MLLPCTTNIKGLIELLKRVLLLSAIICGILLPTSSANAATLWNECGDLPYSQSYCSYITSNTTNSKTIAYRDSIQNLKGYAISGACKASTSTTVAFTVSASVSGEIKAGIFGGIKTTINAGVQKSTTTGYETSASFTVPKYSTVHCDRGVVRENVSGYTRIYDGGRTWVKYWSAYAPESARWWIY